MSKMRASFRIGSVHEGCAEEDLPEVSRTGQTVAWDGSGAYIQGVGFLPDGLPNAELYGSGQKRQYQQHATEHDACSKSRNSETERKEGVKEGLIHGHLPEMRI
jgi:hypothetical protein